MRMAISFAGTLHGVSTKSASPQLAEAARAYLASFVRRFDGNATAAAKALGVSQPTVTNILNGRNVIGFPVLEALAAHERVPFDVILGRAAPTEPVVELQDRYPNRARALAAWRLLGRDAEAAEGVAALAMDRDDDPSPDEWFADLEREEARLRRQAKSPTKPRPVAGEDDAPRMPWRK